MRDAAQERGLDHVAAAQGRGLDHLGLQRVALQRRRQQRFQRRRDAGLHAPQRRLRGARRQHRACRSGASLRAAGRRRCARPPRPRAARSRRCSGPSARASRSPTDGSVSCSRPPPRSSSRAISADRSASRRRSSASSARLRATCASELAPAAATKKTASATQFSPLAIVKRPVGGMWKKLNDERARERGRRAPATTPQTVATTEHHQQVDDARARATGATSLSANTSSVVSAMPSRRRRDPGDQRRAALEHALRLSPDLLRDLDDQPQLVGLLLGGQRVALDRRGEAALRRQAELVEVGVLASPPRSGA